MLLHQRWNGKKVLLFCDNLDAHVASETREIFAAGNVFLFCLPPTVTESLQTIDAGYGHSMMCAVGRHLDNRLIDEDNMSMWEDEKGMDARARRVLVSKLVAQANEDVLKDDKMRIGCFIRTGMLMTLDGSDDDKIRPQGLTCPVVVPSIEDISNISNTINNFHEDEINVRSHWDENVDDGIHEENNQIVNEATDVVLDDEVGEGENDDFIVCFVC